MEEKLFKTALEFIQKYDIASYVMNIHASVDNYGQRIKMQGRAFENYKVFLELNVEYDKENGWYTYSEGTIDLILTTEL